MNLQDILKTKDSDPTNDPIPEVKKEEEKEEIGEPLKGTFYYGDFRLVDKLARPIPKVGDEYKPVDEMQIAELEYQVSQFRVQKTVVE